MTRQRLANETDPPRLRAVIDKYVASAPLVPSAGIKIRSWGNFCRSESDSADAIVARIETLTTSSED
jgi:hypothetical protein